MSNKTSPEAPKLLEIGTMRYTQSLKNVCLILIGFRKNVNSPPDYKWMNLETGEVHHWGTELAPLLLSKLTLTDVFE